jgi:hypothetical protein
VSGSGAYRHGTFVPEITTSHGMCQTACCCVECITLNAFASREEKWQPLTPSFRGACVQHDPDIHSKHSTYLQATPTTHHTRHPQIRRSIHLVTTMALQDLFLSPADVQANRMSRTLHLPSHVLRQNLFPAPLAAPRHGLRPSMSSQMSHRAPLVDDQPARAHNPALSSRITHKFADVELMNNPISAVGSCQGDTRRLVLETSMRQEIACKSFPMQVGQLSVCLCVCACQFIKPMPVNVRVYFDVNICKRMY